jgi:hypothetical protein
MSGWQFPLWRSGWTDDSAIGAEDVVSIGNENQSSGTNETVDIRREPPFNGIPGFIWATKRSEESRKNFKVMITVLWRSITTSELGLFIVKRRRSGVVTPTPTTSKATIVAFNPLHLLLHVLRALITSSIVMMALLHGRTYSSKVGALLRTSPSCTGFDER